MGISCARKAFGRESTAQNIFLRREGERQYVIKEKSSEVDDGEFLLLRPNYLVSEPEDIPAGMTNVKRPGRFLTAAVGDGISDDTSSIQAVVNHAASSKNNNVFFPRGEYLVSSNIAIPRARWNFTEHRAVSQLSSPRLLMFFKFTMLHQ